MSVSYVQVNVRPAVHAVSLHLACSDRIHHVRFPNPFPTQQTEGSNRLAAPPTLRPRYILQLDNTAQIIIQTGDDQFGAPDHAGAADLLTRIADAPALSDLTNAGPRPA
jgi:hypothetical protein